MQKTVQQKNTESALSTDAEFELYKDMYEQFGATDEVMEYAQKVLMKARAIEFSLTGQIYDRIIRINRQILRHKCVTPGVMNQMFNVGQYKEPLLEFCHLVKLRNQNYVQDAPNTIIHDVMAYGEKE